MRVNDRAWSVDIDGQPFIELQTGTRQFRIDFMVQITRGSSLSLADISIYNLSEETKIERGKSIRLRAGFDNNIDTIFTGIITNTFRERIAGGSDVRTRLICRSGASHERGTISTAYGKNANVLTVLDDIAAAWPARLDIDPKQFEDAPLLVSGYVADGDLPTILDSLAAQFEFDWNLDNGRIAVNRLNRTREGSLTQVDQFSGMIGIPEVSRGPNGLGVYVVTTLNPALRIYDQIEVKSRYSTFNTGNLYFSEVGDDVDANGKYNVFSMVHRGDSHSDVWATEIDGMRTDLPPPNEVIGDLIWGAKVSQDFRTKVKQIAKELGLDPNWLMAIMAFETGRTFNPAQPNLAGGGATGLIQFMPNTAIGLGTTTQKLARMSAVEQLDYVKKYFEPHASRIRNLGDSYMAVLWPAGIGKADSWVMWTSTGPYAAQYAANSGLDKNRDGTITRSEAVGRVNDAYREGRKYIK